MTDKRTTELREKLTERGVEFATDDSAASKVTMWTTQNGGWIFDCDYMEPLNEKPGTIGAKTELMIFGYTPEQAIAATLGSGTLTAEQVRKVLLDHLSLKCRDREYQTDAWQAIADELNARAERTCRRVDVNGYGFRFECSACGYVAIVHNCEIRLDELPNYCPNCGAKVKK